MLALSFIAGSVLQLFVLVGQPQCPGNQTLVYVCHGIEIEAVWRNGSDILQYSNRTMFSTTTFINNDGLIGTLFIRGVSHYDNGSVITCSDGNSTDVITTVTILVYGEYGLHYVNRLMICT